jgi:SAM-dependent methyltransferase
MHDSVMIFGQSVLTAEDVRGRRVIEVGSMNVNGSLRSHIESLGPTSYVGIDFAHGPGVDVVCDASDLVGRFGTNSFDVVLSTEMLEHAQNWRAAISAMKYVLSPGGVLVLTARGPGFPLHGYPHDWHRFVLADMQQAFADFAITVLKDDPQHPGVMLVARKPTSWHNTVNLASIVVACADEKNAPR